MVATVTAAARIIAAVADTAVAVLAVIPGVKSSSKAILGATIVEAVSWLTSGVLYLIVPAEGILLPVVLNLILLTIPAPRQANGRGR